MMVRSLCPVIASIFGLNPTGSEAHPRKNAHPLADMERQRHDVALSQRALTFEIGGPHVRGRQPAIVTKTRIGDAPLLLFMAIEH